MCAFKDVYTTEILDMPYHEMDVALIQKHSTIQMDIIKSEFPKDMEVYCHSTMLSVPFNYIQTIIK